MNFDRLAPHYDRLEAFTAGSRLQTVRTAWLGELSGRRRILSVGEGHGRFAAACTERFPDAALTCVEASPRMLARARERTRGAPGNITWVQADFLSWTPPKEPFDAIVTCFFLDCFPPDQLATVVAKLAGCATADAVWLVADFALPARGPARWRALATHALMYGFFRLVTALPARHFTAPDAELRRHGFRLEQRRATEWGLLQSDLWRRG